MAHYDVGTREDRARVLANCSPDVVCTRCHLALHDDYQRKASYPITHRAEPRDRTLRMLFDEAEGLVLSLDVMAGSATGPGIWVLVKGS